MIRNKTFLGSQSKTIIVKFYSNWLILMEYFWNFFFIERDILISPNVINYYFHMLIGVANINFHLQD